MIAYVFPGQGSQSVGMGEELFDKYKDIVSICDGVLGYSIKELCLEDKDNKLDNTRYTQPALFTVSVLSYLNEVESTGVIPDYVAGHSLGEYTALFAAGVFDFKTGLSIVKKRGELMSLVSGGAMAAVMGLDEDQVLEVIRTKNLDDIDIANLNTPKQIVISGPEKRIDEATLFFEEAGCRMVTKLNVSGAFHSRYMKEAQDEFEGFLDDIELKFPDIPVISNVTGKPYTQENFRIDLIKQISSTVRWLDSVKYMMDTDSEIIIKQIGPGKVLTGMINRIKKELK